MAGDQGRGGELRDNATKVEVWCGATHVAVLPRGGEEVSGESGGEVKRGDGETCSIVIYTIYMFI